MAGSLGFYEKEAVSMWYCTRDMNLSLLIYIGNNASFLETFLLGNR